MEIKAATDSDYKYIVERDRHMAEALVENKIKVHEIFILWESNQEMGWMRFGYFWDNTPFMNMLWVDEEYRGLGYGKKVVLYWEELMREKGFNVVMTSTQSDEEAQHFYRSLGYKDAGCLLQENAPLELIFTKNIG